jgi:hypothetical protein
MFDPAIISFDPSRFFTLPPLTAQSTVALSHSLYECAPKARPQPVEAALGQLEVDTTELESGIDNRRRGGSSLMLSAEANLDGAGDGAWLDLRDRLRCAMIYARPGFVTLAADVDAKVDYAARVDRAARAGVLMKRLFGRDGLSFLRYKYTDQVVAMASLLRIITEDGLAAEIDAVLGEGTVALLQDLQWRYEAMVNNRTARERLDADDLKARMMRVRQAIQIYAITVMGTINPADPKTIAAVEDALRPIIHFRAQGLRGRSGGGDGGGDGGEMEEGFEAGEELGEPGEGAPVEVSDGLADEDEAGAGD